MNRNRVAMSDGKPVQGRGAGLGADLRTEGPSGPCRTYRPGEIEWAPLFKHGRLPRVRVTGDQLVFNCSAMKILGSRIKVGYEGAARQIVFRSSDDGEYAISKGGHVTSKALVTWLRERGLKAGLHVLEPREHDLVHVPVE